MAYIKTHSDLAAPVTGINTLKAAVLVLCFAFMQTVPSVINGYPFIFFDSRGYNNAGKAVVQTFAGKLGVETVQPAATPDVTVQASGDQTKRAIPMSRSPYYGVFVFAFLQSKAFLLVLMQSLVVAYAAWLVVRQICPDAPTKPYLISGAICAVVTPLPYFAGYAMPDVFAALVPLCLFLLCFAKRDLSVGQLIFCWITLAASVAFHNSHILLTFGLLALTAIMALWPQIRPVLSGWILAVAAFGSGIAAVFAFAFVSHAVFGSWPQSLPFLTGRGIEDGPVAALIADDCAGHDFAICDAAPLDNRDSQYFLWDQSGFYQTADEATKQRLSDEDFAVFLTAARAYPMMQLKSSVKNTAEQFNMFGLHEFRTAERVITDSAPHYMTERALAQYAASRAVTGQYPFFVLSFFVYVAAALSVLGVAHAFRCRAVSNSALALLLLISATLLMNAVICGVLSDPHHRYQARVIWLLPFLATLLVFRKARA